MKCLWGFVHCLLYFHNFFHRHLQSRNTTKTIVHFGAENFLHICDNQVHELKSINYSSGQRAKA